MDSTGRARSGRYGSRGKFGETDNVDMTDEQLDAFLSNLDAETNQYESKATKLNSNMNGAVPPRQHSGNRSISNGIDATSAVDAGHSFLQSTEDDIFHASRKNVAEEDTHAENAVGPGANFILFVAMENLYDKLKLLDCDEKYCRANNIKPIANLMTPTEQYLRFSELSEVCLTPQGHTVEFPPGKLKSGCGEFCIRVMDVLANETLKRTSFSWHRPTYPKEEDVIEELQDDDSELVTDQTQAALLITSMGDDALDEIEAEDHDDDEIMLDLGIKSRPGAQESGLKPDAYLESTTNADQWRLEVERVLPQLKVTVRSDLKDWRVHVDQIHQYKSDISQTLDVTKAHLDRLSDEINRVLEKIGSREKYVNSQLEGSLNEFRLLQDQLAELRQRYKQASGGVTDRSQRLAEVTDELERVKQEMDERGNNVTDAAPLVRIKQSMQKLKQELHEMDVRTGVLEHQVLAIPVSGGGGGGGGRASQRGHVPIF